MAGPRLPVMSENTDRALQELLALGLHPTTS